MNIDQEIFNVEDYRQQVTNYFDSIIKGRIMQVSPNKMSRENLLSLIVDYDISKQKYENFMSWLTIGETQKMEFSVKYDVINLITSNNSCLQINFSSFRYPMSLYDDGICFQQKKANYISSVDFNIIEPSHFFPKHIGERLLHIYNLDCVNHFHKRKICYFFAKENMSETALRNYFTIAQKNILKDVLLDPNKYAPFTTIKVELEGRSSLHHNSKCKMSENFVNEIFFTKYKKAFEQKLNSL